MTVYASGHRRLNYRVTGVCIQDGYVLLQQMEHEPIWALPGGRPALYELSGDALVREMLEEIETRVAIGRLLWVMENVFTHDGTRFHEIGFYYQMFLPAGSPYADMGREHRGREGEIPLIFRWFDIDELEAVPLFPEFLRTALRELPGNIGHVVKVDPE